jgi:hypothetical protein
MKMEQSVSKRRHIKFRRRGITQKKTYNIQNTAKNQEQYVLSLKPIPINLVHNDGYLVLISPENRVFFLLKYFSYILNWYI